METKKRSFFKSLRGRLSLQMLLVSLVPILVIGGLVYRGMNNSRESAVHSVDDSRISLERDVVQSNLRDEAHQLALELEKDVADRIVLALFSANGVSITGAVTSQLQDNITTADYFLYTQLLDTQYFDVFTYYGPEIPDPADPGHTIIPLLGGAFKLVDLTFPGAHPGYWAPPEVGGISGNLKNFPWYSDYLHREGGVFVGELYWRPAWLIGTPMGMYLMDIVVPIMDSDGVQRGILVGTRAFEPQLQGADYAKKYPNTRVMVFSRSNEFMADSGEWKLSKEDLNGNGLLDDVVPAATDANGNAIERWYDHQINDRVPQDKIDFTPAEQRVRSVIASAQDEIIPPTAFTTDDGNYVVGYARSSNTELDPNYHWVGYKGTGFTVMVEQSKDVAFAPLASLNKLEDDLARNTTTMMVTLAIVLVVALIAALVMAFTFSRRITKPVTELRDVADKVSKGEMDVSIDVKSKDEIGDLAEAFGRMVAAVRFLSQDQEKGG